MAEAKFAFGVGRLKGRKLQVGEKHDRRRQRQPQGKLSDRFGGAELGEHDQDGPLAGRVKHVADERPLHVGAEAHGGRIGIGARSFRGSGGGLSDRAGLGHGCCFDFPDLRFSARESSCERVNEIALIPYDENVGTFVSCGPVNGVVDTGWSRRWWLHVYSGTISLSLA